MATISQSIAWTKSTAVHVSPPSVNSHAVLSGIGLTVNGKPAKSVSIPRGAAAIAFDTAMVAGRNSIKVERTSRGRPSTTVNAGDYAARVRAAQTASKPRKARSAKVAPEPTATEPTA